MIFNGPLYSYFFKENVDHIIHALESMEVVHFFAIPFQTQLTYTPLRF